MLKVPGGDIDMVEEIAQLRNMRLGAIQSVIVGVAYGSLTVEDYEQQEQVMAQFLGKHDMCSTFWVITRSTRQTDEGARQKVKQMSERFRRQVRGSAIVVTAPGAGAVLIRTFISAIALITNPDPPMRSFRTVPDGVAWLQALPSQDPLVAHDAGLQSAIEAFASVPAPGPVA
jgi:hypothetical protein